VRRHRGGGAGRAAPARHQPPEHRRAAVTPSASVPAGNDARMPCLGSHKYDIGSRSSACWRPADGWCRPRSPKVSTADIARMLSANGLPGLAGLVLAHVAHLGDHCLGGAVLAGRDLPQPADGGRVSACVLRVLDQAIPSGQAVTTPPHSSGWPASSTRKLWWWARTITADSEGWCLGGRWPTCCTRHRARPWSAAWRSRLVARASAAAGRAERAGMVQDGKVIAVQPDLKCRAILVGVLRLARGAGPPVRPA
jgi:hypothetical protein